MDLLMLYAKVFNMIQGNRFEEATNTVMEYVNSLEQSKIDNSVVQLLKLVNETITLKAKANEANEKNAMKTAYQYLAAKYGNRVYDMTEERQEDKSREIWWCWLQGVENAPEIVQACLKSLDCLGDKINIVTADNFSEYVEMPDYIIDKWKQGIIPNAHFSDLLRLFLLCQYGGTWIDATLYATGTGDYEMMKQQKLFAYKHIMRGEESNYIFASNWLLHTDGSSNILKLTKQYLLDYWREENSLVHYFIFHLFFTLACYKYPEEWIAIPSYSNVPCHIMQMEMGKAFRPERFEQLKQITDMHKLSYKIENKVENSLTNYLIAESKKNE